MTKTKLSKRNKRKLNALNSYKRNYINYPCFGLLTVNILGLFDELEDSLKTVHQVSHVIKDVLDGMSPREAIEKNMTENDEEEE